MRDMLDRLAHMLAGADPTAVRVRVAGAAVIAAAAMLVAATCVGCGGVPREARVAAEQYGEALDVVDRVMETRIRTAGGEAREQVRGEIARGEIMGVTPDETYSLGMERYDELMAPLMAVLTALDYGREGAEALDLALDAWASGTGGGTTLTTGACALAALMVIGDALLAAGVELPSVMTRAIEVASLWARESCPPGGAW